MKKKELMKRLSAMIVASMVAVTAVPATAFADDIEFVDDVQDADIDIEEDTDGASDVATYFADDADAEEGEEVFSDANSGIATYARKNVEIVVQDTDGNPISGATISLYNCSLFEDVNPSNGLYDVSDTGLYTLTVTADGYKEYKLSWKTLTITSDNKVIVTMEKEGQVDPNQAIVDSLKAAFDEAVTDIAPASDATNINTVVADMLKTYKIDGTDDVKVTVYDNSNDYYGGVKSNGDILWRKQLSHDTYTNVRFKLTIGSASAITETHKVIVGWNINDNYKPAFNSDMNSVKVSDSVTDTFTLPLETDKSYAKIAWTSSNTDAISIDETGTGTVHRTAEDQVVTLTAKFTVNPTLVNTYEKAAIETAVGTQEKTFTVTVKGSKVIALTNKIAEAKDLLAKMETGTDAGQYPVSVKNALATAIENAEKIEVDQNEETAALSVETLTTAIETAEASVIPEAAKTAEVTVNYSQKANEAGEAKSFVVKSNDAAAFGYTKPEAVKDEVTVTDALYRLHAEMYGDAFTQNPTDYLVISSQGWISKIFGITTSAVGTVANNKPCSSTNDVLNNGANLSVYLYNDTAKWSDEYLYFQNVPENVIAGESFTVELRGLNSWGTDEAIADCTVALKNLDTAETVTAKTDKNGAATLKASKAGKYQITVTAAPYEYYVVPTAELTVTHPQHDYVWKTIAKATVSAPEKQQGTCSICGDTITRKNGTKLAATIKLNAKSIKLQQKQTTKKIKVTMANGDSIKSWKSSNKKIVTVNKKGVIKAGKKNGTAKITVTLASGKKATLKVKVQSARVNTTKIKGLKTKVSLKKGEKLTLKPVISPLTSQDKVTYTSSNKKVATVNKKGVITAKKKGTVKITVKSGKKSYTVKVKVK